MVVFKKSRSWFFTEQKTWFCIYNSISSFYGKWKLKKRIAGLFPVLCRYPVCFSVLSTEEQTTSGGIPVFVLWIYKWANLKNCTKLHCEFHKWIKIIAFLCALKKITILFQLNGITDFVISSFKWTEPTSTHCTHEMCQWHKQPVPFDSLCRAYLIAVQCQFILTLAEKYFNRPSTHIPGKNLLCR